MAKNEKPTHIVIGQYTHNGKKYQHVITKLWPNSEGKTGFSGQPDTPNANVPAFDVIFVNEIKRDEEGEANTTNKE